MERLIEFEGRRISVPPDATDDEIISILEAAPARASAAPQQAQQPAAPGALLDARRAQEVGAVPLPAQAPAQPSRAMSQQARGLMLGAQATGAGLADIAGLPFDLSTAAANLLVAGADKASRAVGGPEIAFRFPAGPLHSQGISQAAAAAAEAIGVPIVEPQGLAEKTAYNAARYGTQGVLASAALAPAAAARAAAMAGPRPLPRAGDAFLRPYVDGMGKAVVGDAVAGAAGGATLTASQELIPQSVRDMGGGAVGIGADLAAQLTGAVSGATLVEMATKTPTTIGRIATGNRPDRRIPLDPETGEATSNRVADLASRYVKQNTVDPETAAASLRANANEMRALDAPPVSTGALSNDPKLMALERSARRTDPGTFASRDIALRDAAREAIDSIAPAGASPRIATDYAAELANGRVGEARSALRSAEGSLSEADASLAAKGAALRLNAGASATASEELDRLIIEKSLRPMDAERRAQFAAIPRDATVPGEPFVEAASRVRASASSLPESARSEVLPEKRLQDFESLRSGATPGEGPIDPMRFGTINDLRPILSAEIARNRVAGAPAPLLDNLETLRGELNRATNALPEARQAMSHYTEVYAPVWGRGAGAAHDFRQAFNVDRMSRTASPPTATAARFLGTGAGAKEKAEALQRVIGSISEQGDRLAAESAVRQYVLADASKAVGADGKITEQALRRWYFGPGGWNDALSQFPALRGEIETMIDDVAKGGAKRGNLATQVEAATARLARTREQIDASALSLLIGRDPTKAARAVLESRDPQMAMRELVSEFKGNPSARRAWERAVVDHIVDRVSTVNPAGVSEGATAVDFAKLTNAFRAYEKPLAELLGDRPDAMNALRRAQRMLEPLAKVAGTPAPRGSFVEGNPNAWIALEAALKARFGVLKGGGIMRTVRLASSLVGDDSAAVQRLVTRMWFDPDLAAHLMTRKGQEVGTPAWNAELARLLRRSEAARTLNEDD